MPRWMAPCVVGAPASSIMRMSSAPDDVSEPLSPCVGICRLDARGYCVGCLRDMHEIMHWRELDDSERRRIMNEVLPAREAS